MDSKPIYQMSDTSSRNAGRVKDYANNERMDGKNWTSGRPVEAQGDAYTRTFWEGKIPKIVFVALSVGTRINKAGCCKPLRRVFIATALLKFCHITPHAACVCRAPMVCYFKTFDHRTFTAGEHLKICVSHTHHLTHRIYLRYCVKRAYILQIK